MKTLKIGELTARIPVIQGGMDLGISLSGLAGSVAACGGVGVISTAQIGYRDPEFKKDPIGTNLRVIGEEIQKAREIAKGGILGVNIMVATKQYAEYVKAAVKAGIDLIISGAGLPMELPKLVAGSKTKIAPIVSTVKAARSDLPLLGSSLPADAGSCGDRGTESRRTSGIFQKAAGGVYPRNPMIRRFEGFLRK